VRGLFSRDSKILAQSRYNASEEDPTGPFGNHALAHRFGQSFFKIALGVLN
jgi:hypothetical protein